MKNGPLVKKFEAAFAGVRAAWTRERNFRLEVVLAIAAVAVLLVLRPGLVWWALVALVICLVLSVELLNSALEALIDHLHPDRHPEIKTIKDMAAGIVLLVSIGAAVVGVMAVASVLHNG